MAVTIDLLSQRHDLPSTREIASAAGVAEGTLFRVFDTKDALVEAVVGAVVCPAPLLRGIEEIDTALPLRERALCAARLLMARYARIFALLGPLGVVGPPTHHDHPGCPKPDTSSQSAQERSAARLVALFEPDAAYLRLEPAEFTRVLRMLALGGCHRHVASDHPLTPEQVTDLLLDGALRRDAGAPAVSTDATGPPEGTAAAGRHSMLLT